LKISRVGLAALLALGVHACAALAPAQSERPYVVHHKRGSYADVLEDVRQAIIGRGMVIGAVSHVAEMLDRTVAVGYRRADPRSTSSAIFRDIEKLLADIVREAVGG
jgi:hypothetical protein